MKNSEWFSWLSGLLLLIFASPDIALCQDAISDQPQAITNSIGIKLVPIPAGRFTMGSPASERGSQEDEVLHKVDLTQTYHMGATEVTEHQWAMVMEEPFRTEVVEIRDPETKRLVKKEERQIKNPKLDSQLPMTGISWVQAMDFCKRLGQLPEEKKEGRNYRLPTEAEWEYACRAESSTAYSYGDDTSVLSEYAWYAGNSREAKPKPIAQKRANTWGLYDMHGNVAEWCHEYYGEYSEDLVSDPVGPKRKSVPCKRLVRGGFFQSKESQCRSSWRGQVQGLAQPTIGLRVLMGARLPEREIEYAENGIGQRFVKINAGRFMMGSENVDDEEIPVHEVVISRSYFMAETEVTQAQWKVVADSEPWKSQYGAFATDGPEYPAMVSWTAAVNYCQQLSERPEEKAAGRVYRLPTEAEWEYACRAGTQTNYCFGDDASVLADFAWYSDKEWVIGGKKSASDLSKVAHRQPNQFGLFDMHGNVDEWCSDWFAAYGPAKTVDPTGPVTGLERIARGGSFCSTQHACQSAYRNPINPNLDGAKPGFRVVFTSTSK